VNSASPKNQESHDESSEIETDMSLTLEDSLQKKVILPKKTLWQIKQKLWFLLQESSGIQTRVQRIHLLPLATESKYRTLCCRCFAHILLLHCLYWAMNATSRDCRARACPGQAAIGLLCADASKLPPQILPSPAFRAVRPTGSTSPGLSLSSRTPLIEATAACGADRTCAAPGDAEKSYVTHWLQTCRVRPR